jgi:hypothetical protein
VDAYLRWKPNASISITAGKTKPLIGHADWLESTNSQATFERSQIFNQLGVNRATGLTAEGTRDLLSWCAGIYSNDTPSTTAGTGSFGEGEFGDFNGGVSTSIGAGYDFKHLLNLEKADFRLDWLHSEREPGDSVLGKYDDIASATFSIKEGYAALVIEGFAASGGSLKQSDSVGFYIQPTYDILPKKADNLSAVIPMRRLRARKASAASPATNAKLRTPKDLVIPITRFTAAHNTSFTEINLNSWPVANGLVFKMATRILTMDSPGSAVFASLFNSQQAISNVL